MDINSNFSLVYTTFESACTIAGVAHDFVAALTLNVNHARQ